MEPLEVFALDENMNRLTGSIPYISLQWNRRYYEPGQFSLVVGSDVYSPEWAFIYCDLRPETGIVNKVEFDDSSTTYGGIDTVTVSGFFLEQVLNNFTFLAEETEEQIITRQKPEPVKTKMPNLIKAEDGKLYTELEWWSNGEQNFSYMDVETGQVASKPAGEYEYMELDAAEGYEEIFWPTNNTDKYPDGKWSAGYYKTYYSYYTEDGELHSIDPDGVDTVVENVIGSPSGKAIIDDGDGTYSWVGGVVGKESQTYYRRAQAWEYDKINRPGVIVSEDGNSISYKVEVKGPWQLRTDIGEVGVPVDNVQTVIKWCQRAFGNSLVYDEAPFSGVEKVIEPSFKRMGDLFFEELKTVEASCRLLYDFVLNQCVFQVWRGFDRTQRGQSESEPRAALRRTARIADDPVASADDQGAALPSGYRRVEYIESSGTQYIDTGVEASSEARIVVDIDVLESNTNLDSVYIFGVRGSASFACKMSGSKQCAVFFYNAENFVNVDIGTPTYGRHVIDLDKGSASVDGEGQHTVSSGTFSTGESIYVSAQNNGSAAVSFMNLKIYSIELYESDQKVRSMVPCVRSSDGAAGMYDTVGGSFYGNSGTGSFSHGQYIECVQYFPNSTSATGTMQRTCGVVGSEVEIAECGFENSSGEFEEWNTGQEGEGASYSPGDVVLMPDGGLSLYAQWAIVDNPDVPVSPSERAPWAVFSDTWGTMYGYAASRDDSNYRNLCYVLHDVDVPEFNDDGSIRVYRDLLERVYYVAYNRDRGFSTVRLDDEYPDLETYLDARDQKPACDADWSRDAYEQDPSSSLSHITKSVYDAFFEDLDAQGERVLTNDYPIVYNLDTGTLNQEGYRRDFDLGDLVDMEVSSIGIKKEARIIGVGEAYDANGAAIQLEIGDELLTVSDKSRIV